MIRDKSPAMGTQSKLDKTDPNNLKTSEVLPMNTEYESRTQFVIKQGRSTDAIRESYETPYMDKKDRPAYFGLDSNGKSRTKSRYEKY